MRRPFWLILGLLILIVSQSTGRTVHNRFSRAIDDPSNDDDDDDITKEALVSSQEDDDKEAAENVGKEDDGKDDDDDDDGDEDDSKDKSGPTEVTTKKEKDDSNTSEDEDNGDSKSNPETEEEGDSFSSSDEDPEPMHTDDGRQVAADENLSASDSDESTSNSDESSETKRNKDDPDDSGQSSEEDRNNKLLIILLDGLRAGSIEKDLKKLKAFQHIRENGVHAEAVKPVIPSSSYPNYYSIVTGLYPNKHQIIANDMYSVKHDEIFSHGSPNYTHSHWWNRAEPLWIRAKRSGKRVAAYWWPGCEIEILKTTIDKCLIYKYLPSARNYDKMIADSFDEIVSSFKGDTLDLAMVYYENIDAVGHEHGPESRAYKKAIRRIDALLYELIQDIHEKLNDSVNVYIISDHGQSSARQAIWLEDYVDFNHVQKMIGAGAFAMILPEPDKIDFVKNHLDQQAVPGLNVYTKESLPSHFHLQGADHLLPIILTTDPGYLVFGPKNTKKVPGSSGDRNILETLKGYHGGDPEFDEALNAVMYAYGPDFREGYTLPEIEMVDHYNLLCHLLDIRPRENDGEMKAIEKVLKSRADEIGGGDDDSSEESGETTEQSERNEPLAATDSAFSLTFSSLSMSIVAAFSVMFPFAINCY